MPPKWPSRACLACKAKKVKCDETDPNPCQRCLKSGATCVYRPESEIVFRDMTSLSETKVQKRVKAVIAGRESSARPSTSSSALDSINSKIRSATQRSKDHEPRISLPMSTNWREIALPRFFADYVFESPLFSESGLSFLPELCGRPNLRAPLREALNAVSWLSLSNQLGLQWLKLEACGTYFHAVQLMSKLLQDPDEAPQDATLATNYVFGLFEMISGFTPSGTAWSPYRHHAGRVSLLELRGKEQFNTSLGINLFRACYGHVVLKCIAEHVNPTEEANIWLETIPRDDPGLELSKCNLRTARLCHEAQMLFDSNSGDGWWMVKMLMVVKEAILIDLQYQQWTESLPAPWRPRNFRKPGTTSKEELNAENTSKKFPHYVYEDVYVAWASNNCRATRIHLHEVLLHCLSLIQMHPHAETYFNAEQTRIKSRTIISEMIEDICACTDFCLGDIDSVGDAAATKYRMPLRGYLMVWTHWRAYVSAPDGSECKLWLRSKLEFISNSMGIQAALAVMRRISDDPWDMRSFRP